MPKELVKKYLDGLASPDEARKILRWFRTSEGKRYLEHNLEEDFENLADRKWLLDQESDPARILGRIYQSGEDRKTQLPGMKTFWSYRVAASMALAGLVLTSLYFYFDRSTEILYATRFGERKEIALPDNSKVILNGNSYLRISSAWKSDGKREVWLSGEAFFNVVHTGNHNQFVVHASDNFTIQVLGTEFNVSSRQNKTTVALEKGKVQLNIVEKGRTSRVTMKPGEFVEFDQSSSFLIKKEIKKVESIASWKDEMMELDQTSVKEIADILENTYGLKMIIDDSSILDQKISGSIPNRSIDLFLHGLAEILEVKVAREGGVVYLTKNDQNN